MAATISASGTFSTISTSERPVQHHTTVEERFDDESLLYEDDLKMNKGGFPELEQFLALMGQAYGAPGRAMAVRLFGMLNIYLNRASRTGPERSYTP